MNSVPARRLAWSLCAVTFVAAVVQLPLRIPRADELADRYDPFLTFPIITVATLAAAVVGAVIVSRQPRNPVGWLFCVTNCVAELGLVGSAYAELSGLHDDPLPLASYAAWFQTVTASTFALSSLVFLLLLFPTGRLPSHRWRVVAWVAGVNWAALELLTARIAGSPADAVPVDELEAGPVTTALFITCQLVLVACLLAAVASLVMRRRVASNEVRQQLKLFALAATAFGGSIVLVVVAAPLENLGVPNIVPGTLFFLAYGALPVTAGLAILKYRLYDIDVALNRAFVLTALVVLSTVGYVAVVVAVGALLGERIGSGTTVSLLAMAGVAVAVQPARRRIHRLADALVYGRRATPYEVLASFSDRLGDTLFINDVLPRLAEAAARGVGAASAEVRLRLADGTERRAAWPGGHADARTDLVVPVVHEGDQLGELRLDLPAPRLRSDAPLDLLRGLAAQSGLALRNVRLTEELRLRLAELTAHNESVVLSRHRLVTAQTEQRQRLEREIAERVRPPLDALAAGLPEVARRLHEPARAGELLEELAARANAALEGLRDLARGVFPPLLAERGLLPALAAATRSSPVPAVLQTSGELPRYDVAVEAAAYFCALEVLSAGRATSGPLQVAAITRDDRLILTVRGVRVPDDVLASVQDRAGAAGGLVTTSGGKGSQLSIDLPAHRPAVTAGRTG